MSQDSAPASEFILYSTEDGQTRIDCRFENETIRLSQNLMAELYTRSKKTISEHLQNLFEEGELLADSVVRNFRTTAADSKSYDVQHYNLEAILVPTLPRGNADLRRTRAIARGNYPEFPDSSN